MAEPQQRPPRFPSRRELGRILAAAASLIVVMTVTLGLDLSPGLDVKVGSLAPADIAAPRADTFTNEDLTAEARQAAADAVGPQYDFTTERAITITNEQLAAFARRVNLLDTAFSPDTSAEERQGILDTFVPTISDEAGTVLQTLDPKRWAPIRSEAARVLDLTERNELRDTEVAQARAGLSGQMAGDLMDGERTLSSVLFGPVLFPNISL
jgi:membrane-associated HD superfamily phosphohydrolase